MQEHEEGAKVPTDGQGTLSVQRRGNYRSQSSQQRASEAGRQCVIPPEIKGDAGRGDRSGCAGGGTAPGKPGVRRAGRGLRPAGSGARRCTRRASASRGHWKALMRRSRNSASEQMGAQGEVGVPGDTWARGRTGLRDPGGTQITGGSGEGSPGGATRPLALGRAGAGEELAGRVAAPAMPCVWSWEMWVGAQEGHLFLFQS